MKPAQYLAFALGLSASLGSAVVGAQPVPDAAVRRQLVERALAAREAGDHAGALELFVQAGQVQMRPGLRMSIAQEQQALGRGVAACESASQCVVEVQADLTSPESARVMQGCAALVSTACAPLGRVQVRTPTPLPAGLRVEVQGRPVDLASGSATVYVEPGEAAVRATLPGRAAFAQSVSVRRGVTASVSLDLAARAAPVLPSASRAPVTTRVETPHPASGSVSVSQPGLTSRWWFWTGLSVLAVGGTLAGLAAGGVFDTPAPALGGTAYTIEAISVR